MAAMQGTKLFKLASQINIGKDTIVEFLQSKGFKIENKPTTALSEEMVDIVMDKFSKELRAVEKQREKIERHKIGHHKHSDIVSVDAVIEPAHPTNVNTNVAAHETKKSSVGEDESVVISVESEERSLEYDIPSVSEKESEPTSIIAEKSTDHTEKTDSSALAGEVVELPQVTIAPAETHETERHIHGEAKVELLHDERTEKSESFHAEPTIDAVNESVIKEVEPVVSAPKHDIVMETVQNDKKQSQETAREEVVQEMSQYEVTVPHDDTKGISSSEIVEEVITPIAEQPKELASPTVSKPSDEPTDEHAESEDGGGKRKKKRFTPVEYEAGTANQLRGLTVLGKIDLGKGGSGNQNDGKKSRKDGGKFGDRGDRKDDRRDRDRKGEKRTDQRPNDRRQDQRPNDRRQDQRPNDRRQDQRPNDQRQDQRSKDKRPDHQQQRPHDKNRTPRTADNAATPANKSYQFDEKTTTAADEKTRITQTKANIELEMAKSKHKLGKRGVGVETIASKIGIASKQDEKKKKVKGKKSLREVITEEEVERAIRETRQGMDESSTISQRSKLRQKRKMEREEKEQRRQEELNMEDTILRLTEFVSTSDLANLMRVSTSEVIMKCMKLGLMVTINQRLDKDTITLIADDYGFTVEFIDDQHISNIEDDEDDEELLVPRPPIVTIMGHVDHGKTSLLDYIRKANVVAGEAGGITQHIGAYHVTLPNGKEIGFLDTPGHEAFTAMRARGAQVTDIVVLVVAADDQVMPQTIEAISHANAANVPIVVALNKIDRAEANPDKIKQQLADHGVLVEDWGGKYQCVHVSAKQGLNVDVLLEKILLEAELLELKANPDREARGTVIEAHLDKGKGILATVLVQKGTLRVGDPFVVGIHSGRVRAMFDERGNRVQSAGPSIPVQLSGFDGLPSAGDIFVAMEDEAEAKEISARRQLLAREQQFKQVRHTTLDDISAQIKQGGTKELKLIIKGDVGGSVEALSDSLYKLSRDEVKVNIILKGVGSISEGDVMLAAASDAVIIGFNTAVSTGARRSAETEGVDVRLYNIIYDCINEIQLALEGLLSPEIKEEITSTVEVRQIFKISKLGVIAGCYVQSGKITRNDKIRVLRDGFVVFKGGLQSLKRIKDDVREVDTGFECGIAIQGFNDFEVGDIIEGYKITEIKRKLT